METPASTKFPLRSVLIFSGIGLVLRLGFNLFLHPPGRFVFSDMMMYDAHAKNLLSGHLGPWDTFSPPGYPALLALCYLISRYSFVFAGIVQAFVGTAIAPLVALISWRLNRSRRAAIATCALNAAYVPLIVYGGFLLTEVSFSFFATWTVLLLMKARENPDNKRLRNAAIVLAVAVIIRPQFVLLYPFLILYFAVAFRPDLRKALAASARITLIGMPLFFVVFSLNSVLLRRPTGFGTNSGLNFFLAHSDYRTAEYRKNGKVEYTITPIPNGIRYRKTFVAPVPLYNEAFFYREGMKSIAQNPQRILTDFRNVAEGLGLGVTPYWPGWDRWRVMLEIFNHGIFWVLVLPIAFNIGRSLKGRRIFQPEEADHLLLLSILITVLMTFYIFLGDPRMRVTFDPLLIAWALDTAALKGF